MDNSKLSCRKCRHLVSRSCILPQSNHCIRRAEDYYQESKMTKSGFETVDTNVLCEKCNRAKSTHRRKVSFKTEECEYWCNKCVEEEQKDLWKVLYK